MPRPTTYNSRYKNELSPRQSEVLELIGRGNTNQEIADALGITLDGAKWHVSEILAKLDVGTREEAAELWRAERRPGARLSRWARGVVHVLSLRPVIAGAMVTGAGCAAAGAALLFLPVGGDGALAGRPPCETWQVGIRSGTSLSDQSATASVQTFVVGQGGRSCKYSGTVTVSFLDNAGNVLGVDGNGFQLPVEGGFRWVKLTFGASAEPTVTTVDYPASGDGISIATEGGNPHQAVWWNWCGEYRGPVTVRVTDIASGTRAPDAYVSSPPRCDDASKPSTVRADWR